MKTTFATLLLCSLVFADARATGFAVDPSGNLFFLGANPGRIFKFSPDGTVTKFATEEADEDWSDIAIDVSGNLFVSMTGHSERGDIVVSILKFTPAGQRSTFTRNAGSGQPTGLAIDRASNLFVGIAPITKSSKKAAIFKFDPKKVKARFAQGLEQPAHFAFDPQGNLFVFDQLHGVLKFAPNGNQTLFATGFSPYGLTCDAAGNLFAADFEGDAILKFDRDGTKTVFATKLKPWFLAVNNKDELFVLGDVDETGASGILKFAPDATRTLFAKNPIDQK